MLGGSDSPSLPEQKKGEGRAAQSSGLPSTRLAGTEATHPLAAHGQHRSFLQTFKKCLWLPQLLCSPHLQGWRPKKVGYFLKAGKGSSGGAMVGGQEEGSEWAGAPTTSC